MQKPTEYNAVLNTFCVSGSDEDNFPALSTESNFVFGNELSPFLMEFTEGMEVNFYPAPMRLQQKTGQVAYRHSHNTMYFIGGTDTTYTFYSKKVFKFNISEKEVLPCANMKVGKAGFCIARFEVRKNKSFNLTSRNVSTPSEDTPRVRKARCISTLESTST